MPPAKTIVWTAAIAVAVNIAMAKVAAGGAGSRLGV